MMQLSIKVFKNWRWWVVAPYMVLITILILPFIIVGSVLKCLGELLLMVDKVSSKPLGIPKLVKWVHGGIK
jgi:hypothetical protein